ncbi:MAG: type II toxin-antitoxin system RelE/ParE family toxin [Deltaproteobacteria bacterium]|nr:type II toxin-antitoxin system RelE/ParE family toxin [Deltaproteobacteria bacterium]
MRLRWSKEARADLIEARRFVAENNPRAASRLAARIVDAVEHLERNPQMGRAGFLPGTRELVVATTPYIVIYEVLPDQVSILGVVHGRRDRSPELDD